MTFLHLDSHECGLFIRVFIVIRPSLYTLIVVRLSLQSLLCVLINYLFIFKYTNITPPANSKANRGRWCVDGLRFFTIVDEMNNLLKGQMHLALLR